MKKLFCFLLLLTVFQAFADDYICLNVRYQNLKLGEHSFVSIIKNVSKEAYCSGDFGCAKNLDDVTTYSLWGARFGRWRMFKNKKQGHFDLGDELILSRKAVNFIRHCKKINYSSEVLDYISQMEKFNSERKKNLHWGYYYGATQFNCTSFSVEFFNKIANENYKAISPTLRVETPAMLALEIMEKMKKKYSDDDFFQKLKGVDSKEEKKRQVDLLRYKDRVGNKL